MPQFNEQACEGKEYPDHGPCPYYEYENKTCRVKDVGVLRRDEFGLDGETRELR